MADVERLREIGAVFGRLGVTAFGGPAVHIALMEDEVVRRRGWIDRATFLDLLGATNLLPGPNSTEMALHLGYQRAGLAGLVVAGLAFVLPAALITAALAMLYVRWGSLPAARSLLYGIDPVVLIVVLIALVRLGPTALRTPTTWAIAAGACAGALVGVHELWLLLAAALLGGAGAIVRHAARGANASAIAVPAALALVAAAPAASGITTTSIFLFFLKIGSVLYGSGYVLLAFLRAELVERRGWLSDGQVLDAIAVGQFTPGPLFSTATFVGYLLAGGAGAAAATVGIFAPAFAFVALSGPLVRLVRSSTWARAVLDAVTAASLGLMAAVWLQLVPVALVDLTTVAIALITAIALARRINPAWCLVVGAAIGLVRLWLTIGGRGM
jgi:chromate transporter